MSISVMTDEDNCCLATFCWSTRTLGSNDSNDSLWQFRIPKMEDKQSQLLWIKEDTGKGEAMLMVGIVDELQQQVARSGKSPSRKPSYFCQSTKSRLNTATSILGGILYLLTGEQEILISHLRNKYYLHSTTYPTSSNKWPGSKADSMYDALGECDMDLISRTARLTPE
jgi:hypothetical protein